MKTVFHPSDSRGYANHGWLEARHSFSFASWYQPDRLHFGALRVLNDDIIQGGMGFGTHPHDNMEIVTIPVFISIICLYGWMHGNASLTIQENQTEPL